MGGPEELVRIARQRCSGMRQEMTEKKSGIAASIVRSVFRIGVYALCVLLFVIGLAAGLVGALESMAPEAWSPLHIAVSRDDTRQLQTLLQAGADPNIVDGLTGRTPVLLAAKIGNLEAMKELLDAGADPETADRRGETPIHLAVRREDRDGLTLLLEAGADLNSRDSCGQTPLHVLADAGEAAVLGLLVRSELAFNADEGSKWFVLERLAVTSQAQIALDLLRAGASLKAQNDLGQSPLQVAQSRIDVPDRDGWTALHVAALIGDGDLAHALLAAEAQPDRRGEGIATPLRIAASRGHLAVAQALINGGADIDAKDADEDTALIRSIRSGHLEVARLLRDSGARTSVSTIPWPEPEADTSEDPPSMALHWAAWLGESGMLTTLLESGLEPSIRDREGRTPLHIAAGEGHLEAVRVLLAAGAETQTEDAADWMPVTVAAMHGHADVVRAIESASRYSQVRSAALSRHMKWVQEIVGHLGHDEVADMDLWQQHDWVYSLLGKSTENSEANETIDAAHGHLEDQDIEQALVRDGVATDAITSDGATLMHLAVLANDADEVRDLLAAGGDPNATSNRWGAPLALAVSSGGLAVVDALLEGGADPNGRDPEGRPMIWAASSIPKIQALLKSGADPDARYCSDTLLHEASREDEVATALVLLEAGADPMARTRHPFGWTPLKVAEQWGSMSTTRLIKLGMSRFSSQ